MSLATISAESTARANPSDGGPAPKWVFGTCRAGTRRYERLRSLIVEQMSSVYDGWDDALDRRLDPGATLLHLAASDRPGRVLAVIRVVDGDALPEPAALPLQLACRSELVEAARIEASGFAFFDRAAARTLGLALGHWLDRHDLPDCYACYDVTNPLLRRLYLTTFGMRTVPCPPYSYPGFCRRGDSTPVQWQLVVNSVLDRRNVLAERGFRPSDVRGLAACTV